MQLWVLFGMVLQVQLGLFAEVKHLADQCAIRQGLANCSASHLTYVPLDLSPVITALDVSNNQISSLDWPLPYFHVVHLNLSKNSIHWSSFQAFFHLFSLDTLDLSFNNVKYLSHIHSNYSFYHTPQLVNLILRGNPLKSLVHDPIKCDSLRYLDVSECAIGNLDGETSLLQMPNLKHLILSKNPLTMVDILVSESLEELHLCETQMRYIKPEFYMGLPRLQMLDLSKNFYLTSLSRAGIANSSNLRILKAEFCSLEYLQIRGFPKLEQLYLKGNRIDRISRGEFGFNGRLVSIDLSKNWIHQIDPFGFDGAIHLGKLDLSGNKIFDLGRSLSPLSRLSYLNLSDNPLFTIEGVEEAPLLKVLDASHCELSSLAPGIFSSGQLESVNFSKNAIWSLPPGMTSFTLIDLDLSYNRLTEIDDSWFKHFPRLKSLHFVGNRLSDPFHPDTVTRLEHVTLSLEDNPWRCNCGESRYRKFYMHLSSKGNAESLICRGPENVTGLSWTTACFITEASVKKDKKNAWLPMLISALVTLGIIIMLYLLKRRTSTSEREHQVPPRDATDRVQSVVLRTPPREESRLPTYEEALLMPKPNVSTKTNADTQTQATFLGSVRSLDARNKRTLVHSPSSSSL